MASNTRLPSATSNTGGHLPPELWLQILGLLHPPEILSLGKTFKAIRELTKERDFWVDVLRTVLFEHGIFPPTYPVDEMEIGHLRRAAMGPYLWNDLVQDQSEMANEDEMADLQPLSTTHIDLGFSGEEIEQYLVPGGRFLATARFNALEEWDLGVPASLWPCTPFLLTSVSLTEDEEFQNWSIAFDASWLRIVLVALSQRVRVYEVHFGEEKPVLRLRSGCIDPTKLDYGEHGWHSFCHGNRVCINSVDHELIIWDYIENRYTFWSIQIGDGEWMNGSLVFTGDLLILFSTSVKIWNVPCPDRPCDGDTTYVTWTPDGPPKSPPDVVIPFPFKPPERYLAFFSFPPDQWHPRPGNDLFFDAFYNAENLAVLTDAARYRLAVVVEGDNSAGPTGVSAHLTLVERLRFPKQPQISMYPPKTATPSRFNLSNGLAAPLVVKLLQNTTFASDRTLVPKASKHCIVYLNDSKVTRNRDGRTDDDDDDAGSDCPTVRLVALPSGVMANWGWSLCSASGRLVYFRGRSATRNRVVVAHYLPE